MFLLNVIRFIRGYVRVKVEREGAERFINLCSYNKILIWEIKNSSQGFFVNIKITDYKKLKNLRKSIKFPPKFRIHKKYGLPFILKSYEKRKGLAVGVILSLLLLNLLSSYIWDIKVVGNQQIATTEIIATCEELGVKKGIRKRLIDTYNLKPALILKCDGIAWCSFNVEGSVLTIDISEVKDSSKDKNTFPSNIVATIDGVIISTEIAKGTRLVENGQAIRKGDLLVSGAVNYGEKTDFIQSEGKIIAETDRVFTKTIPLNFNNSVLTGKQKTLRVLEFFNLKIPLFLGGVRFNSQFEITSRNVKMFGKELPISIVSKSFKELTETQVIRTEEEALNQAKSEIAKEIKSLPITKVEIIDFLWENKGDCIDVALKTKCYEDIGRQEKIIFNKEN